MKLLTTQLKNLIFYKRFFLLCFLLSFPILGGLVANPDPARFADSFKNFFQSDKKQSPRQSKLTLFTGSSSIRMWKTLSSDFPQVNLINRGFGGAHISDLLHYYERLFPAYQPERIVMYCGENDLWSGKPVSQVFNDFKNLRARLLQDLPTTTLIYLSCKPSPQRISKWSTYQSLNLRIKNACLRDSKLTFVDLTPTLLKPDLTFYPELWKQDNLHVNQAGYEKWKKWLLPTIKN
jgi:lysophospholipase L1-like esterase